MPARRTVTSIALGMLFGLAALGIRRAATSRRVATADPEILAAALRSALGPPADRVAVDCRGGVVTLRGLVDWPAELAAAERAVRTQPGVLDVVNLLRLSGSSGGRPGR